MLFSDYLELRDWKSDDYRAGQASIIAIIADLHKIHIDYNEDFEKVTKDFFNKIKEVELYE